MSQILEVLSWMGDINIFVLRDVFFSRYVQLRTSFSEEKKHQWWNVRNQKKYLYYYNYIQILERHVNDCFELNDNQMIKISIEGETFKFKNYTRKIKLLFMIYADFESILVPKNNEKQNSEESYTNKYRSHISWSFGYKIFKVFADDQFSKSFKSFLGQYAAYKFITNIVEESNTCSRVMKEHFHKELAMTKEDDENFEISLIMQDLW